MVMDSADLWETMEWSDGNAKRQGHLANTVDLVWSRATNSEMADMAASRESYGLGKTCKSDLVCRIIWWMWE